jgi:DNA-binding Xre family transcriptional regulator
VEKLRDVEYDDVVQNIKTIISEKGMKQTVVAERAGFSDSDFSNMLNERRKLIRIEHIPRITKALGVTLNDLFRVRSEKGE